MPVPRVICGMPVRENPYLTVAGTPYQEKRPWRERLFTWPWRPLRAYRTVTPQVPDPKVYVLDTTSLVGAASKVIIGHPETLCALEDQTHD